MPPRITRPKLLGRFSDGGFLACCIMLRSSPATGCHLATHHKL